MLTGRWCLCPGPRNWHPEGDHKDQSSESPRLQWTDRGHSTHQPTPGGTEEYTGRASGTEKSSEEGEKEHKSRKIRQTSFSEFPVNTGLSYSARGQIHSIAEPCIGLKQNVNTICSVKKMFVTPHPLPSLSPLTSSSRCNNRITVDTGHSTFRLD